MGHPPIENLLPKTGGSVYKLSRMAAKRAAELASGKKTLVETDHKTKTATIALEEIAAGQVVLDEVQDQFKPEDKPKVEAKPEKAEEEDI